MFRFGCYRLEVTLAQVGSRFSARSTAQGPHDQAAVASVHGRSPVNRALNRSAIEQMFKPAQVIPWMWLMVVALTVIALSLHMVGLTAFSAVARRSLALLLLLPLAGLYVARGAAERRSGAGNAILAHSWIMAAAIIIIAWNTLHAADRLFSPVLSIVSGALLVIYAFWKPNLMQSGNRM